MEFIRIDLLLSTLCSTLLFLVIFSHLNSLLNFSLVKVSFSILISVAVLHSLIFDPALIVRVTGVGVGMDQEKENKAIALGMFTGLIVTTLTVNLIKGKRFYRYAKIKTDKNFIIQDEHLPSWWPINNDRCWSIFNYFNWPLCVFDKNVQELIVVRHTKLYVEEMYIYYTLYNPFKIIYAFFESPDSSLKRQQILSIMSLNFDQDEMEYIMLKPGHEVQALLKNGNILVLRGDYRLKATLYDEWCKLNGKSSYKTLFARLVHSFD